MSRNGAGTYSLPAGNPVVTGTSISSTWANTTLTDLASAVTASIANDGQTPITANLPMTGFKHTNVAAATARTEYAQAAQVQDSTFQYLSSVAGTDTITATAPIGMTAYAAGQVFRFFAAGANTGGAGGVTVNINSIGALPLTYEDGTALLLGELVSGEPAVILCKSGTSFILINRKPKLDQTLDVFASQFIVAAQSTPNMTVSITGGNIQNGITRTTVAAQNTSTLTAPVSNPRNDLVVIDQATGAQSVVTGTEAASPSDPSVPIGKTVLARIRLTVGMSSITSASIDDLRSVFEQPSLTQIQTISTPTFASGAMTIPSAQYSLDFRSATLGSGGTTNVSGTPAALVVPSGATLGTVSGQQSTIPLLVLNNSGTLEYAVVNLSGGVDLSETGLISTTAISASSTANNVVYSTTARTNVPYRVVGAYVSTQTTAGTWATAPTLVQGAGGQALAAMSSIGYGQAWQNVAGSRVSGTTYYNTKSRPITFCVSGTASGTSGSMQIVINGVTVESNLWGNSATSGISTSHVVPPGGSYSYTNAGYINLVIVELS